MQLEFESGKIIGKINADPNPVPFGKGCVLISWETNDPAGAEVRVSTSSGEEKVVSQGRSGQTEIRWVVGSTAYDFRLYAASQPTAPIDSVEVKRDFESVPVIFRELADDSLPYGRQGGDRELMNANLLLYGEQLPDNPVQLSLSH